jgi:hypothetical protein
MRGFVHVLIVAATALVGGASAVWAADTTCTSTLTGTIDGNVVVPDGASCTLSDATVAGNVHVRQNASLTVDATQQPATIDGNLHADHCAFALLEGGVTVTGNVRIGQCAQQSGFVGPGIKIGGDFECTNNPGACEADLGDVHGNLQIDGNSGASADISLVSVGGNLRCHGNTPMPTHAFGPDFVSGDLQGQCAASLGFAPPATAPSCIASTLNVPNLTVASATHPAAGTSVCIVTGAVATSGEGYGLGSAQFEVRLPVQWNGRFLFFGCGGNCGTLVFNAGAISTNMVDGPEAASSGYATVWTDAGHEQDPSTPDLTWAVSETGVVNMPAIIDFYYRAVHQVTVATKQYVEACYSQRLTMLISTGAPPAAARV